MKIHFCMQFLCKPFSLYFFHVFGKSYLGFLWILNIRLVLSLTKINSVSFNNIQKPWVKALRTRIGRFFEVQDSKDVGHTGPYRVGGPTWPTFILEFYSFGMFCSGYIQGHCQKFRIFQWKISPRHPFLGYKGKTWIL